MNGKSGVAISITSDSSGHAATLSCASGVNQSSYLTIQDSTATGGAIWADAHGIGGAGSDGNVSGNTGWIFSNSWFSSVGLAGAGTLSASANRLAMFDLAELFAGSGSLTANAFTDIFDLLESFAGVGSLAVGTNAVLASTAVLAGVGNLSASTNALLAGIAAFAGSGSISANATLALAGLVVFSGSGNLNATITSVLPIAPLFAGAGNLAANEVLALNAISSFVGVGSLSTSAQIFTFANPAEFDGVGGLSASSQLFSFTNPAEFDGAGTLSVNAKDSILGGFATFNGLGTLSASTIARLAGPTTFNGTGILSGYAALIEVNNSAAFAGAGNFLIQISDFLFNNSAQFGGSSRLCAYASVHLRPRGPVSNISVLGPGATNNVTV